MAAAVIPGQNTAGASLQFKVLDKDRNLNYGLRL